ncbi:endothelin converting enzyme, putative [Ixodes scapularis]|uniref:Endothelin converting enzyme, putative n=1 Tax=Ixodes scapularis TaxID=6945 RepID=B7PK74_IXOSC|nr:endothelin converting enzyme, putative [Ixodes scapularis]|eukprot:XP_002409531.1 endothelin converting enzyme, putative [Ixodes scapularis]
MSADNHAKPDDDKGEPHENDKCMDDGHQRRPNEGMSKLRAQVTSAVANIPSLVIVLLCVLLLVFFVIIIALAVQVHSSGSSEPPRCLTATCLATAAGVLGSLDARADPCVEPYALGCDGAPSPLAGHRSRLDAQARLRHSVHHRLRHLVDLVPPQAPERSAASKVKRFYETCMEPRGLTPNALAVFVHMARQAGGWDLIRTSAWSMQSWDRDTTLEKLIVDLGVTPFFRITVASPDVSVIRVSAPFLFARSPRSYSRNDKGAGLAVPSQPGWLPCSSSNDDSWSSRTRARTRMLAWRRLGHFTSQ